MNALEGLLWRNIRGVGLAYGCNIINDVERGLIYFRVRHEVVHVAMAADGPARRSSSLQIVEKRMSLVVKLCRA